LRLTLMKINSNLEAFQLVASLIDLLLSIHHNKEFIVSHLEMTKKAFRKLHKDFRNNDLTNPRALQYVPGKGTVSMPVKFIEEA